MTDERLKELERVAREATPGPWIKGSWHGQCHIDHPHGRGACKYDYTLEKEYDCVSLLEENVELIGYDDYETVLKTNNAEYIAALNPTTALELISLVRKYKSALKKIAEHADTGLMSREIAHFCRPYLRPILRLAEQALDEEKRDT